MAASISRRALHFVFKVPDRTSTIAFCRDVLQMKVLRHEEFEEGCKAACNGPYDGRWSKTMIGYGKEQSHFVLELTYNYGIKSYKLGNDFQYIFIHSKSVYANALKLTNEDTNHHNDDTLSIRSPCGYMFLIKDKDPIHNDPVQSVCLGVSNLSNSIGYWESLLGMKIYSKTDKMAVLGYAENQAKLSLELLSQPLLHEEAYGRIAFSCPKEQLVDIEKKIQETDHKILTPLVSLDTPGKATVQVVILADPDGHEICFVGDESFRQLSEMDPKADQLLNKAMSNDKSVDWFEKKKKREQARNEQTQNES